MDGLTESPHAGTAGRSDRPPDPAPTLRWLLGSGLLILAGRCAEVGDDAATWFGARGPHCLVGSAIDPLACPGCGLVRATSSALQGDIGRAWLFHPAGPVIAALCILAFAAHLLPRQLLVGRAALDLHDRLRRFVWVALPIAIGAGWLLKWFRI